MPLADQHPSRPQAAEELRLRTGSGGRGAHLPAQRHPGRFGPAAAPNETNGALNAITAAATTPLAGYLLQNAVFGTVGGRGARFVVIGLPVIAEAAAATWLSHRLPPTPKTQK